MNELFLTKQPRLDDDDLLEIGQYTIPQCIPQCFDLYYNFNIMHMKITLYTYIKNAT